MKGYTHRFQRLAQLGAGRLGQQGGQCAGARVHHADAKAGRRQVIGKFAANQACAHDEDMAARAAP